MAALVAEPVLQQTSVNVCNTGPEINARSVSINLHSTVHALHHVVLLSSINNAIHARFHLAMCDQPCQNGGTCAAPNACACSYGWEGPTCESIRTYHLIVFLRGNVFVCICSMIFFS